ncbi:MAG: hypothetical protein L0338_39010 [Acidobacteria bacterium]|nr:hypothetical protein [Acidobacteriota bacterium]
MDGHKEPRDGDILVGYVTPAQLARLLRRSRRTLDRWHALRIGPPRVQVGRLILYRRDPVEQWLGSREQCPRGQSTRRAVGCDDGGQG